MHTTILIHTRVRLVRKPRIKCFTIQIHQSLLRSSRVMISSLFTLESWGAPPTWSTTHRGLPSPAFAKNWAKVNLAGLLQKNHATNRAHRGWPFPWLPGQGEGKPLGHLNSSRLRSQTTYKQTRNRSRTDFIRWPCFGCQEIATF